MIISDFTDFKEGSQSIVFLEEREKRAYKAFKSYKHPSNFDENDFTEEQFNIWKKNVYKSEATACQKIAEDRIKEFFPLYFGNIGVEKIIDRNRKDISEYFLLDCVLVLELIPYVAYKQDAPYVLEHCEKHQIDLPLIFNRLVEIGVSFFIDSSIFCFDNTIKIIDVATDDIATFQPPL